MVVPAAEGFPKSGATRYFLLFDPPDLEGLASHLQRLISDPAELHEWGCKARQRAIEVEWSRQYTILKEALADLKVELISMNDTLTISSLVCRADVETAIHCLRSLRRFSDRAVRLILHDDGSLTDRDMMLGEIALPKLSVARKPTSGWRKNCAATGVRRLSA